MKVTMVRVYITEADSLLEPLMGYLHDDAQVKGVTVFRAVTGFGKSGEIHSSSLIDLSFDLPLTIEFFDEPLRISIILEQLKKWVEPGHVICWDAELC